MHECSRYEDCTAVEPEGFLGGRMSGCCRPNEMANNSCVCRMLTRAIDHP